MESTQKRRRFKSSAAAAFLPSELILEILLRLPVKSLCRFRCVSRSWLALIKHPRFVEMHVARSPTQHLVLTAGPLRLFDLIVERYLERRTGHSYYSQNLYAKSLYSVDLDTIVAGGDDCNAVTVEIDFPCKKPNQGRIGILGSCNGLLCIMPEKDVFYVFNPSTRECKFIPEFDQPRLKYDSDTEYGFGHAKSMSVDDYKFVKIARDYKIIQVYSLRNDSWKSIPNDVICVGNQGNPGVFLNGAIHWVYSNPEDQTAIAAFDLVEEKFKKLPLPDSAKGHYNSFTVGLMRGCLCLCLRRLKIGFVNEFWVMMDYGVKESWTKISLACKFHSMQPLCFLKESGKMLIYLTNRMLVFCNQKDGKVKQVRLDGNIHYRFNVDVYEESLVSPNYNNDIKSEEKLLEYWFK